MSYWSGKRILVTGGGGFLGHHVVDKLCALDCEQIVVGRRADYDLRSASEAHQLFDQARPDILIHLAGLVGGIGANQARPADFFYENTLINTNVIECARSAGVEKVVATAAGCGYPEGARLPLSEESFWDGFPQRESAPYSLAKRMLHVQSLAYWAQHKLPIVVTIPGNIYGPHDNFDLENAHVIAALARKFVEGVDSGAERIEVWGTGKPTRDFIYAGDVAEGILKAAETFSTPALLNLASGIETSTRQIVETLRTITNFEGEIAWNTERPDGQSRRVFNVSHAQIKIGWSAHTPLVEGLERTVAWYRENRWTARNGEHHTPILALAY